MRVTTSVLRVRCKLCKMASVVNLLTDGVGSITEKLAFGASVSINNETARSNAAKVSPPPAVWRACARVVVGGNRSSS